MPNVAICSMFNDSIRRGDLARYIRQIEAQDYPRDQLRVYAIEGDSVDQTYQRLMAWRQLDSRVTVGKCDLGQPVLGSVVDKGRFLRGNIVGSGCRQMALADGWADYILWIESDLIWGPYLVSQLVASAERLDAGLVAPWIYVRGGDWPAEWYGPLPGDESPETHYAALDTLPQSERLFYDTWAFRHLPDGKHFTLNEYAPGPMPFQVWSAGSCLLARADVVAKSNTPSDQAIVGWCRQAIDQGATLWCDPAIGAWHKRMGEG